MHILILVQQLYNVTYFTDSRVFSRSCICLPAPSLHPSSNPSSLHSSKNLALIKTTFPVTVQSPTCPSFPSSQNVSSNTAYLSISAKTRCSILSSQPICLSIPLNQSSCPSTTPSSMPSASNKSHASASSTYQQHSTQ